MECCAPGTISDDDLLRYTFDPDELAAEARTHFDDCPACRARADDYRSVSNILVKRLHRWGCPTTLEISEYAAGLLTGKDRQKLEDHFKHCPHCAEEVSISREFLGTPEPAVTRRPVLKAALLQQRHLLEVAGVRGDSPWPRQYTIDGISLMLELAPLAPPGKNLSMVGMIYRLDTSLGPLDNIEVHLLPTSTTDQSAPLSTIIKGINFLLSNISPGSYELLIALPEGNLLIEDLELRL
jgi:hypothetical protein